MNNRYPENCGRYQSDTEFALEVNKYQERKLYEENRIEVSDIPYYGDLITNANDHAYIFSEHAIRYECKEKCDGCYILNKGVFHSLKHIGTELGYL